MTTLAEPTQRRRTGRPDTCTIDGCDKPHKSLGYCMAHYHRYRRHGDPLASGTGRPGRPRILTEAMLEDLEWMARHGECSVGATERINTHTDASIVFTPERLVEELRDAGHRGLAATLLLNDEIPDDEMSDGFDSAGARGRRVKLEKSAAQWRRGGDA
ncbi:hypothetical protein [Cellulosimicrobium sp. Marseille-Q8652]